MSDTLCTADGRATGPWDLSLLGLDAADAAAVRGAATTFAATIADHLGVRIPSGTCVTVHAGEGIAWAQSGTIHLYRNAAGAPDLDQLPHELVHVVAGLSPSRFLSEGLAVHVADHLRLGPPCWPTFALAPDLWLASLRTASQAIPSLDHLIATAQSLQLRISAADGGDAIRTSWTVYVAAGSFVRFLLDQIPRPQFWTGYRAGACWAGWRNLAELERRWLDALPRTLDADASAALSASLQQIRSERRGRSPHPAEP